VHFFHPGYAKPSRQNIEQIVAEVCRAWFYLHQLLTNQWSHHFEAYQKAIGNLDLKMNKLRQFLKAKLDVLKPQIAAEIASACVFENCGVCGFKAARIDEIGEPLHESKCKVCAAERRLLFMDCPRCTAQFGLKIWQRGNVRSAASMLTSTIWWRLLASLKIRKNQTVTRTVQNVPH
jgi:hypothetical protein